MISIVICSRNKDLLESVTKNISKSVGVPYELIVINNDANRYSISAAYNKGVHQSKYDIICFAHEDILFISKDWGKRVVNHFTNSTVGMIGVSGGKAQADVPSAWWHHNLFAKSAINLVMTSQNGDAGEKQHFHYINRSTSANKEEVVIIDGLWFCIRKELFNVISFDEKTFKGFHLYDADISLQVGAFAKRFIVFDIIMEHLYSGKISKDYYTDMIRFIEKWKTDLPQMSDDLNNDYLRMTSWYMLRSFILDMVSQNISKIYIEEIMKKYVKQLRQNHFSVWHTMFFKLASIIGYQNANSFYFRIEKFMGLTKAPGFSKILFPLNNNFFKRSDS